MRKNPQVKSYHGHFERSQTLLQLFLRLGTFQISDLFFNTIGGLAGGIIYFLVNAVAERIRRMRN